jgi:formiminotetrahydrofolate cyclodeaminase
MILGNILLSFCRGVGGVSSRSGQFAVAVVSMLSQFSVFSRQYSAGNKGWERKEGLGTRKGLRNIE